MNTDNVNVTSLHTNTPLTSTDQCITHRRVQSDKLSWQYNIHTTTYNFHSPLIPQWSPRQQTTQLSTPKLQLGILTIPLFARTFTQKHHLLAELLEGTRALSRFIFIGRCFCCMYTGLDTGSRVLSKTMLRCVTKIACKLDVRGRI